MIALNDALIDAPSVAMAATTARPTISADAVAAVRRGLRAAFSWPSRPVMPVRRGRGEPMARARPPATNGASVATPMNVSAEPAPTSGSGFFPPPNRPANERDEAGGKEDAAHDGAAAQ